MEKEIIKSEKIDSKIILGIFIAIGLIVFWIVWSNAISTVYYYDVIVMGDTFYIWTFLVPYFGSMTFLPFFVIGLLFYFWTSKMNIVVTNKRVYGVTAFGKRVDIPLNKISAISTCLMKGIGVSYSSGVIRFRLIKNNLEIYKTINKMLIDLQDNESNLKKDDNSNNDVIEELKEWKKLLDDGAITKEEFEKEKKKILNS